MRSRSWRLLPALLVCLVASALPVTAQEPAETMAGPIAHAVTQEAALTAFSTGGLPPVADRPLEIGVGVGGVMSLGGGGGDVRVTVTIPRHDLRSLEGFVGIYRGNDVFNTRGVYGFQVRQDMARIRRPGVEPFATFGLMGIVARLETSGCPHVNCGARVSTRVLPPFLFLAGVGAQYTVKPHVAVRLESQVGIALFVPVGVRVAAGVSIPLGHVTPDSLPVGSR
jgi:hypothetical protein